MGLITGAVATMLGGVSQQDESIRATSQVTEAVNCWLSPAHGNGKRPPTQLVAILPPEVVDGNFFHSVVRDRFERYLVVVNDLGVRVFDHMYQKEYTVSMAAGALDYLQGNWTDPVIPPIPGGGGVTIPPGGPIHYGGGDGPPSYEAPPLPPLNDSYRNFKALTISDSTFIVNKSMKVKMLSELSPGTAGPSFQLFTDIPDGEPDGPILTIQGDPENDMDTYYVQGIGVKLFKEVAKQGIVHRYDFTTMPHVLKRIPDDVNPDGFYFSFGPHDWDIRPAGDEKSNPPASFVGNTIQDMFIHRDRLSFVANETIVMSETNFYFNFWRTTVTQKLDTDIIDTRIPSSSVVSLKHAVPFQQAVMIFGEDLQVQLSGQPVLTSQTVKTDQISNYPNSTLVTPVLAGDSLFYISETSGVIQVREYGVSDVAVTGDSADITGHCPRYIPSYARTMCAAPQHDAIFIAPMYGSSQLYVYNFHYDERGKQQSAWSRWVLGGSRSVVHMHVIDGCLHMVATNLYGSLEILKVDLKAKALPGGNLSHDVLLDRRILIQGVWNALGSFTEFTIPYMRGSDMSINGMVRSGYFEAAGSEVDLDTVVMPPGEFHKFRVGNEADADGAHYFGFNYEQSCTLSRQFLRKEDGTAVITGRLQLRNISIAFNETAFFSVQIKPKGRDFYENGIVVGRQQDYDGRTLGDASFKLNKPTLSSGVFKCLVGAQANTVDIVLKNPTPYPSYFQSATWEAMFTTKARL